MKRSIKVLILLISLFFIGNRNVYAISGDYVYDGFKYNIKKIHLDIYKSKLDKNNNYAGYDKNIVATVDLPDTYILSPTYYDIVDTSKDYIDNKDIYAMLNLNVTKDQIFELLKTKITKVDKDNHYFIRMIVDYSLVEIPEKLNYSYKDIYDNSSNSFILDSENPSRNTNIREKLLLNQVTSEVFGNFEYKLVNNNPIINYSDTFKEGMPIYTDYYFNKTFYSSVDESKTQIFKLPGIDITTDDENTIILTDKKIRSLTFCNYKNMKEVIENDYILDFSSIEQEQPEEKADQVVEVPDTVSKLQLGIYALGTLLVIVGSLTLVHFLKKEIKIEEV